MVQKKYTKMQYSSHGARTGSGWRTFVQHVLKNKALAMCLIVGVAITMYPTLITQAPKIAQADMLSILKTAAVNNSNAQNATPPPLRSDGTPLTENGSYKFLCPDGQVESGIEYHRDAPSPIKCVPCPPGTVRMFVAGAESCHPPGWKPDYSKIPPGYEVGNNGQVCRSDGQSYAGSFNPRYKVTYPGYGECCNGGTRNSSPVVAGSSVALFTCGAPGSPTSGYSFLPGTPSHGATGGSGSTNGGGTSGSGGQAGSGNQGTGTGQGAAAPHNFLCPEGQVESGIEYHRDAPSPIRCVPCPAGTVRMFVAGGESCHPPGWKPDYSNIPPGYEVGANGQICLADGQSYAGSFNRRYRSTQPNFGACCNGGYRDSKPVVAGSSVALFICGGGGKASPTSGNIVAPSGTPPSAGATYQGGQPDENSTFVLVPRVVSNTVFVSYYSTVDVSPTDYAVLQLDDQSPVSVTTSTGGTYQFTNLASGSHTLRGYVAHANGTKVPKTSTSVTFTVQ